MKKIYLSAALVVAVFSSYAQAIEVGVNAGLYTTWLMNKNIFDQGDEINHSFSGGFNWGFVGTVNFSKKLGVSAELNFANVNQKYSGTIGSQSYDIKTSLNYTQIPILLKLNSESGFYFEIGPQFSFLGKATEEYTNNSNSSSDYSDLDVSKGFENAPISIVFGFGGRFDITDHLVITAGLRLGASVGDVTVKYSEAELDALTSTNPGVAGSAGISDAYAHYTSASPSEFKYTKTTLAVGGVQMGLVYVLGGTDK